MNTEFDPSDLWSRVHFNSEALANGLWLAVYDALFLCDTEEESEVAIRRLFGLN